MHYKLRRLLLVTLVLSGYSNFRGSGQVITPLPYRQNFDSTTIPSLPAGWSSSQNRTPGVSDFTTTSSVPLSLPNAVVSTNATIAQSLVSPLFDFSDLIPDTLAFYTRRTATHIAKMIVEVSLDSGNTYSVQIGDTLLNTSTNYVLTRFLLPAVLSTSHGVRFRWRTIAATSGNTGTLRLDDITISVKAAMDIAVSVMHITPQKPVEGDTVIIAAVICNVGLQTANGFSMLWFIDVNNDSLPDANELVASATSTVPLGVADSVVLSTSLGPFSPGERLVIGRVDYAPDQNIFNNQQYAPCIIGWRSHSVVVNEIMYAPSGTEPEWIEVYNTRSDSVNLKQWLVSDNTVTNKKVIASSDIFLPAEGYILLTKDSAALVDIHPNIASRVINVSGLPTFNNSGDAVVLYDNRVANMDSLSYVPSWGGNSEGRSLERIDPLAESTVGSNWGTSHSPNGSSPGARNSLSRKNYDLWIDTIYTQPALPLLGDSILVSVIVKNIGFQQAAPYTVSFFEDVNGDSSAQAGELITSVVTSSPLLPLDSLQFTCTISSPQAGPHFFIVRVHWATDEDTTNNQRTGFTFTGFSAGTIRINEIMYAPVSGIPEWVELLNTIADSVDIKNWRVGNRSLSSRYVITNSNLVIPPMGYLVVAKDSALLRNAYHSIPGIVVQCSSLPTFLWNNSGDAVVLLDNRVAQMDSFSYNQNWGGVQGTSLERIDILAASNDSANWSSSVDSLGSTPGRKNSIVLLDNDICLVHASAFANAPNEDATLFVTVQNVGKLTSSAFQLLLYDDVNRDSVGTEDEIIAQVGSSQPLIRADSLVLQTNWHAPKGGLHLLIAQLDYAPDERLLNNTKFFTGRVGYAARTVTINEIMYSPLTGKAEYIELFNASEQSVDLSQWAITDRRSTSGSVNVFPLSTGSRVLNPGEYFVLASDSTIYSQFPSLKSGDQRLISIANKSSLSLNNDGNDIIVRDLTNMVIDSVAYLPTWHNPGVHDVTGRSLEKIHPLLKATDSRNWSTCTLPSGGTPGAKNSIASASLPSQSHLSFSPNPFSPDGDGLEDHLIIHYEVPLQVSMIRMKVYDAKGRLIRTLANNELGSARGNIVWDGHDDEGLKARVGIYVVFLEAIDDKGGVVETAKGAVVLAAKL